MKKILNIIAGTVLFTLLVFSAASCDKLDVIGKDSTRAFGELVQNAPQSVSDDNNYWFLSAPDGSAKFAWNKESPYSVRLEIIAEPFIAAGLDAAKLPDTIVLRDGVLIVEAQQENKNSSAHNQKGPVTPLSSYEQIVKLKRNLIGYHGAMDHYGVTVGDGNLFEWAKDMNTNDKDIVFVLNPDPFINAGVNPDKIDGWAFANVPVEDDKGKMVEVDKILKPFDYL